MELEHIDLYVVDPEVAQRIAKLLAATFEADSRLFESGAGDALRARLDQAPKEGEVYGS
ncbi:MAG TPA: hypothetical protein VKQ34_01440 [Candidatus Saccharimonadales bacterium]|nr:hypothetical protein [Candidatus Saccharimonadales bacterium]